MKPPVTAQNSKRPISQALRMADSIGHPVDGA
jgi:hypothetical protein